MGKNYDIKSKNATPVLDDSDNDEVTDFLNSNNIPADSMITNTADFSNTSQTINGLDNSGTVSNLLHLTSSAVESTNYYLSVTNTKSTPNQSSKLGHSLSSSASNSNALQFSPIKTANNSKYNMFEDTLSQLQNIRESVVQMKNTSSSHMNNESLSNYALINESILSASLPDLSFDDSDVTYGPYGRFVLWSPQEKPQYLYRRKSWTAINDLTADAGDYNNKSVSLSSLDSEEQKTIRATKQKRRSTRNSTGGISTHSLNESDLARDLKGISPKRAFATDIINRIPLQKSISTSSIVIKDSNKSTSRHLSDSEDENQSLLRGHAKIEASDNIEKRRKRGSLFFRKKKDKLKMKSIGGQIANCNICSLSLTFDMLKQHQDECKIGKTGNILAGVNRKTEISQNVYDGVESNHNCIDDNTPLIKSEFFNEPRIEAQDLNADPALGIERKEHDSWSPGIPKDILKTLKDVQIKRQEHIYEFIMTEKHHCQTLLVMQKIFVESLEKYFPTLDCNKMFPRLQELTKLHCNFLKKLRQKQKEHYVVDSIADILLDFFSLENAQHLRLAYGEFCANYRTALEHFKSCMTSRGPNFPIWYKHCLTNTLLKKKGIPECILFVTQRLTKYPLLIEPLLKRAREDKLECDKLQQALSLVKKLLVDVNACVAEKELRERQIEICKRLDTKSFAIYKNKPFRKTDMDVESKRRLKFEGMANLMQGRSKMQLVMVVVLTDCLCFLVENSAQNKYMFFSPEHKAAVVPLQKLLIREKAGTESRGIYIISSNPKYPEMYELKVQTPKDKNVWIQTIRQAVLNSPSSDIIEVDEISQEEKLRIDISKKEIIEKIRQKDIEQAILLEEKLILQLNLMQKEQKLLEHQQQQSETSVANISAEQFLTTFGSYKDISVNGDCDTLELWRKVINNVQDITKLATIVHTAASGKSVSNAIGSGGEKQINNFSSINLPQRSETFTGFDEKKIKNNFPGRGDLSNNLQVLSPRLQELKETKKDNKPPTASLFNPPENLLSNNNNTGVLSSGLQISEDNNLSLLHINHNLQSLLCIISQQMTTIHSLQLELSLYRESPKSSYTHNDQLEELRNLQDKLQEEKIQWMRQKEQQELELQEKKSALDKLQETINSQQEDIEQQREKLYRKMEVLSNQGLLISPNTPINLTQQLLHISENDVMDSLPPAQELSKVTNSSNSNNSISSVNKRKDVRRTASIISKTPPTNLISANNAAKIQQNILKQKIPMKLSSITSVTPTTANGVLTKIEKSNSFSTHNTTPTTSSVSGKIQVFPLKLADKRPSNIISSASSTAQIIPQHLRAGSSPAIIQHPPAAGNSMTSPPSSTGALCTDSPSNLTYDQRSSITTSTPTSCRMGQTKLTHISSKATSSNSSSVSTLATTLAPSTRPTVQTNLDEEEIYF